MITPRSNFGAVFHNNKIIVFGGFDGFRTTEMVESYDLITKRWTLCSGLQCPRSALAGCLYSGAELRSNEQDFYAYPTRNIISREKAEEKLFVLNNPNDSEPFSGFSTDDTEDDSHYVISYNESNGTNSLDFELNDDDSMSSIDNE